MPVISAYDVRARRARRGTTTCAIAVDGRNCTKHCLRQSRFANHDHHDIRYLCRRHIYDRALQARLPLVGRVEGLASFGGAELVLQTDFALMPLLLLKGGRFRRRG